MMRVEIPRRMLDGSTECFEKSVHLSMQLSYFFILRDLLLPSEGDSYLLSYHRVSSQMKIQIFFASVFICSKKALCKKGRDLFLCVMI
jgi:hypothetical protein